MHARLAFLVGVSSIVGCTQDNPAFFGSMGPTESGESSTQTATETALDTNEVGSGEEGEPLVCPLSGGTPIELVMPPGCFSDAIEPYDRWFQVVGATGSTWEFDGCTENCASCEMAPEDPMLLATFAPIQVGDLAIKDDCLRVAAVRRAGVNNESCDYHAAVVWKYSSNVGTPILIVRSDANVLVPAPGMQLGGFVPTLVPVESCDCDTYPGDCCMMEAPGPAVYEFDIGAGMNVPIGGSASVTLDGREYNFTAYDAFETGMCDEPMHVAWALTLQ